LHVHAAAPHLRTIVLEAEAYPREKICAGAIGARAFRILDRVGISLDVPQVRLDAIAIRIGTDYVELRDPGLGAVVRRAEFDHALADATRARGIEVRDRCAVTHVAVHADHVAIDTTTGDVYRARAVVGADGISGIARRCTGFDRGELRAQVVELDTACVASDAPRDTAVFDLSHSDLRGYTWDFPTLVDGNPLMCRGAYAIRGGARDSPRTRLDRHLDDRGLSLADYRLKQFAERGWVPGAAISAPRVLLVGEAAGIDIATGEGIGQAIEYGALAGPYLARAFSRDDFGFANWRRFIARRHLGRQLAIRYACYRAFYGSRRAAMQRILPKLPSLLRVGVADFAGRPLPLLALGRGACQFLAALGSAGD